MAGKPTIPVATHDLIRDMNDRGIGRRGIADEVGVSLYTVRKALEDDFAAREADRHRALWPQRKRARAVDDGYKAYQAAYGASPERLRKVRLAMATLRARRRGADTDLLDPAEDGA